MKIYKIFFELCNLNFDNTNKQVAWSVFKKQTRFIDQNCIFKRHKSARVHICRCITKHLGHVGTTDNIL